MTSCYWQSLARLLLTGAVTTPLLSCGDRAPTQPAVSFSIVILSTNPQTAQVGSTLPPLKVQAKDAKGHVLYGEVVNFVVTGGGGSVFAPTVVTDITTGVAQETWTLGPVAGPQSVEARLIDPGTGNPLTATAFAATATPAPASVVSPQAGDGQTAVAGSALPISPAVLVTDRFGNPIVGVTVTFAVTGGGGSVVNRSQVTSASGIASAGTWTLGTQAATNILTATSAGLTGSPVTFTATGISAAANQLVPATSTVFVGAVGSTIPAATGPAVRVVDRNNNGVSNVAVTFTVTGPACPSCTPFPGTSAAAPAKIAGVASVTALTDASGRASAGEWTLSTLAGANPLQATAVGLAGSPVTFTATGTAGAAALLFKKSGDGQSAAVGTAVATAPAIQVTDVYGNPSSSGIAVTFTVLSGGGNLSGAPAVTATTDLSGTASVSWTLGALAGTNTLTASGVSHTVTFTATGTGPAGLNIANFRGDGQTQGPGSTLSIPPAAQVTDPSGHPVAGVQVTFSVTAGGGSITAATQVTDVNGIATLGSWTLGASTGLNELQAAFNTGVSRGYTIFVASGRCDDVATVNVNAFNLALSSGQLPSNGANAGRGFFEGTQVIFTGGPIYGTDPDHLVIGADVRGVFQDIATTPVCVVGTTPVHRTFAQLALLAGASGPPGLVTTQESFASSTSPDNGYVLLRYVFHNSGGAPISNFYAGFVTDWDLLFDGTASSDAVSFNQALRVGEVSESAVTTYPQVLGLVPIGAAGGAAFRGWAGATGTGDDIVSTRAGYFSLLSGGINTLSATGDVRELMGLGPLTVQPGQSIVVYVAIVGGENESAFSNNVAAARSLAATLGFGAP